MSNLKWDYSSRFTGGIVTRSGPYPYGQIFNNFKCVINRTNGIYNKTSGPDNSQVFRAFQPCFYYRGGWNEHIPVNHKVQYMRIYRINFDTMPNLLTYKNPIECFQLLKKLVLKYSHAKIQPLDWYMTWNELFPYPGEN